MEIGNKPHPIVPKKFKVARDAKGNLFIIPSDKIIEGECKEVPDIKIRTKCPKEEL